MGGRRRPVPEAWAEAIDGLPPASRSSSSSSPASASPTLHKKLSTESDGLKEKVRIEQELESDRRFFADPPEDYVKCPTCCIIYAVNSSRPATPGEPTPAAGIILPASYSKDLPRAANLSVEEAMRHFHRSRFRCGQCDVDFCRCGASPYHWGFSCAGWQKYQQHVDQVCPVGSCRWCLQPCMTKLRRSESLVSSCCGSTQGTDLKRFPPSLSCAEKERRACGRRHKICGHWCGGVRGEDNCLPCLHEDCRKWAGGGGGMVPPPPLPPASMQALLVTQKTSNVEATLKLPSADDWCPICWTETLGAAPSVRLACGHVLHHHCAEAMLRKGHTGGRRLTFKSIRCPLCQAIMQHPTLDRIVAPDLSMYQKVRRKALQRWVVEQRKPSPKPNDPGDEEKVASLAMQKMSFFQCSQCNEPYYGGEVECGGGQDEEDEDLDEDVQAALAMELVCRGCASKGQLQCPEHGVEFLGWKCRYCCEREAHYFCFGTTHFCYVCHDLWQTGVEQRRKLQAGKPCLGKDRCIFGGRHPANCRNGRDEYALGCTICAQDTECGLLAVRGERRVGSRKFHKNCFVM